MLGIRTAFPKPTNSARKVLEDMLPKESTKLTSVAAAAAPKEEETQVAEVWAYLGVLVQVRA